MNNNPQIVFVKSLFTSKIFLAQVVTLIVMIATMAGYHPAWATEANQAELVSMIDLIATTAFRLFGVNGPVSLTAPIATQAPQELAAGVHTVTVLPPPPPAPPPVPSLTIVTSPAPAVPPIAPPIQPAAL